MRLEDLASLSGAGSELGFVKMTGDPEYLGWVLVSKQRPNARALSLMDPEEVGDFLKEQALVEKRPYLVHLIELKRVVHESDRYETNEDYRMNEGHRFATLDEVGAFVRRFGLELEDIKWRADLNAP